MKLKDYNASIDIMDAEATSVVEKLDSMDPSSEDYATVCGNLKTMLENEQIAIRNKNEFLSGKIPTWATWAIGTVVAIVFGGAVLREERHDGVVSTQAISVWDKVIRKLM